MFRIETRPGRLRSQDLPLLAQALLGYYQGQVRVKHGVTRNLGYVRLESATFHVQVLAEDWTKLLTHIKNGDFNQSTLILDYTDPQAYTKILRTLQTIFVEAYPVTRKPFGFNLMFLDPIDVDDYCVASVV